MSRVQMPSSRLSEESPNSSKKTRRGWIGQHRGVGRGHLEECRGVPAPCRCPYATPTRRRRRTLGSPWLQLTTRWVTNSAFGTIIVMLSLVMMVVLRAPIRPTWPPVPATSIRSPTWMGRSMRRISPLDEIRDDVLESEADAHAERAEDDRQVPHLDAAGLERDHEPEHEQYVVGHATDGVLEALGPSQCGRTAAIRPVTDEPGGGHDLPRPSPGIRATRRLTLAVPIVRSGCVSQFMACPRGLPSAREAGPRAGAAHGRAAPCHGTLGRRLAVRHPGLPAGVRRLASLAGQSRLAARSIARSQRALRLAARLRLDAFRSTRRPGPRRVASSRRTAWEVRFADTG